MSTRYCSCRSSPIDAKAPKLWKDYSKARDQMFERTHAAMSPWTIVRADDKDHARLNIIRDLPWRLEYPGRHRKLQRPTSAVGYEPSYRARGLIAS